MGERLINELENELNFIEDENLLNFTEEILDQTDDEYCDYPSSPSRRHHPPGETQVLHIKRVVFLLTKFIEMLSIEGKFKDLIIVAGILHDIEKFEWWGEELKTDKLHPLKVRIKYKHLVEEGKIESDQFETIMDLIEGHMGKWSHSKFIPRIDNENGYIGVEWIIHFSDNIATKYWGEV